MVDAGGSILWRNAHVENFPRFPAGINPRRLLGLLGEQAATAGGGRSVDASANPDAHTARPPGGGCAPRETGARGNPDVGRATTPDVSTSFAPSLELAFDASVLYGPENARPRSGAIGYVVRRRRPLFECSRSVEAVVSNTALEYRALLEAVAAVERAFDRVAALHVRGDADAVLRALDPTTGTEPTGRVVRRRVARIREHVAGIPDVTYRSVPSARNERAHTLASAGHGR